jgi:hypothetical protein
MSVPTELAPLLETPHLVALALLEIYPILKTEWAVATTHLLTVVRRASDQTGPPTRPNQRWSLDILRWMQVQRIALTIPCQIVCTVPMARSEAKKILHRHMRPTWVTIEWDANQQSAVLLLVELVLTRVQMAQTAGQRRKSILPSWQLRERKQFRAKSLVWLEIRGKDSLEQ